MHRVSVVACARWESDHIEEWVRYHSLLGIDHIYLYCNDDDPTEMFEAVAPYCRGKNPIMTFVHYPFQGEQWKMYMDFIEKHRWETEAVCFLDIDEFIAIKGTNDINEWLSKFNPNWECIFLNWLHYGNSYHSQRSASSVLKNYLLRERFVDHTTKVIVKTSAIDIDFMKTRVSAFWHGITTSGYDCFNSDLVQYDTAGRPFSWFYEDWWRVHNNKDEDAAGDLMKELTDPVMNGGYVAHFFMKSHSDAKRRLLRGVKGNFSNQSKWSKLDTEEKLDVFMEKYHEIEDKYLSDVWSELHEIRPQEVFLPVVPGQNIALNKPCNQSSISKWSGDQTSTEADASRAVNGTINGIAKNHTDFEDSPWWYVDLEEPTRVSAVRVFHRQEPHHRFTQLVLDISLDGENWQEVFRKSTDRRIGGMEGNPLVIELTAIPYTRYVRLSVPLESFLHFDQVEVYTP